MPKPGTKQESPIAASATAKAILRRLSSQLKLRKIDLLDYALHALEAHVTHHQGRIVLPLRFNETFTVHQMAPAPEPLILQEPPVAPGSALSVGRNKMKTGGRS